jgi:hypothetical protein
VGVTRHDYEEVLRTMSEDERATKTWIFLDEQQLYVEWGIYDNDLSHDVKQRTNIMKWCSGLIKETAEYFAKFYTS